MSLFAIGTDKASDHTSAFTSAAYSQVHIILDCIMEANKMKPDRTVPCLQYRLPKNVNRRENQTTKVVIRVERVKKPFGDGDKQSIGRLHST